jgi:hypothetical protein
MLTYNIPAAMVDSYKDCNLIIRSSDPRELARVGSNVEEEALIRVDLLGLHDDVESLADLPPSVPIEIVLGDAVDELGALYSFQGLGKNRPVSINMNVIPGFQKAVKVAVSLGFGASLEVTQPDQALIDEMKSSLEYYLHNTMVDQPVEFFHSLLIAFYDESPRTMWNIQFEDPQYDRYVTDGGALVLSHRLSDVHMPEGESDFLDQLRLDLLAEKGECSICPFFRNCVGYFKLPDRSYSCTHVKELLQMMKEAGKELRTEFAKEQT